jgi:hypothetical protein
MENSNLNHEKTFNEKEGSFERFYRNSHTIISILNSSARLSTVSGTFSEKMVLSLAVVTLGRLPFMVF